jgi:hypothetical protein
MEYNGKNKGMDIKVRIKSRKSVQRLKRIQLIISNSLTSFAGIFTIIYTILEKKITKDYRKQELITARI